MSRISQRVRKGIAATAAALPFLLAGYAGCVETRWLKVTEHTITLPGITAPLTIAHVSDLHMRNVGAIEERTLAALRAAAPDLIVITGDLYDRASARETASAFVAQFTAPLGVWFAPGNWEHWVDLPKGTAYVEAANVTSLVNASAPVRDDLWITGFDDVLAGTPKPDEALATVPPGVARLGIFHSPTLFPRIADRIDLALAGHTHGGQVRLPLIGAVIVPPESRPFADGWYQAGRVQMFVSRGIGTSILPIRFLCRPELAIISVRPER